MGSVGSRILSKGPNVGALTTRVGFFFFFFFGGGGGVGCIVFYIHDKELPPPQKK